MHPTIQKAFGVLLTLTVLSGCGNDGGKFEGKWSCEKRYGMQITSIRNNGGNNYIVENSDYGTHSTTYMDGKLVNSGMMGMTLSIDKQSGKLVGIPWCDEMMNRVK
jgi:hypothetical protein